MEHKVYNLSMVFKPAEDVADQWVAHVLDFDVVTTGSTLQHALEMALDASLIVVRADVVVGRDPLRLRAPDEFWAQWQAIVREGTPLTTLGRLGGNALEAVAVLAQCIFAFSVEPAERTPSSKLPAKPRVKQPLFWPSSAHV